MRELVAQESTGEPLKPGGPLSRWFYVGVTVGAWRPREAARALIRCESSQAKRLFFVSIHNHLYEKSMTTFVLITSLDAKFMLAARARVAERARARRGAAAARPEQCVERLANLPLLAHLASVVVRAGVVVCCDHRRAQRERRVLPLFVGTDVETDYRPTTALRHVAANHGNAERWVPGL